MAPDPRPPFSSLARDQRVRVECFMLVDELHLKEGRFYILGGGIDRLDFPAFPGFLTINAAVRIVVPFTETNRPLEFEVFLRGEDGDNLLPGPFQPQITIGRPVELTRSEEQGVNFPLGFLDIEIPRPGMYVLELLYEEEIIASTWFRALTASPNQPQNAP